MFREDGARGGFLLLSKPPLCKMGLSSSKTHPKVTKVAPMRAREDLPALTTPYQLPGVHPPAAEWGKSTFYGELPPLRETWYGRASAGKGGVINKLFLSRGQRPTGKQLGLRVWLLQRGVGVGVCHSGSVAFCHFQDILALGKLIFLPPARFGKRVGHQSPDPRLLPPISHSPGNSPAPQHRPGRR